jgi:hypothetical protein
MKHAVSLAALAFLAVVQTACGGSSPDESKCTPTEEHPCYQPTYDTGPDKGKEPTSEPRTVETAEPAPCLDTQSDSNNCGDCGNRCEANATCMNGTCYAAAK